MPRRVVEAEFVVQAEVFDPSKHPRGQGGQFGAGGGATAPKSNPSKGGTQKATGDAAKQHGFVYNGTEPDGRQMWSHGQTGKSLMIHPDGYWEYDNRVDGRGADALGSTLKPRSNPFPEMGTPSFAKGFPEPGARPPKPYTGKGAKAVGRAMNRKRG